MANVVQQKYKNDVLVLKILPLDLIPLSILPVPQIMFTEQFPQFQTFMSHLHEFLWPHLYITFFIIFYLIIFI